MKKIYSFIFLLLLFLLNESIAFAQPPANDNCAAAVILQPFPSPNCFGSIDFSTNNATSTAAGIIPLPMCGSFTDGQTPDVWFQFTSGPSADYLIKVDPGTAPSAADLGMAVYKGGCAGPWTLIGCDDNSNVSDMPEFSFRDSSSGTDYFVRIWCNNGTSSGNYRICAVMNPVGIRESDLEKALQAYPNPFTTELFISLSGAYPENCIFNIRNAVGAVVLSKEGSLQECVINTDALSQGIYSLEIISDKFLISKKIVKMM
jgi:hypothetical protein